MKVIYGIAKVFSALTIIFFLNQLASACQCKLPSECVAYSRAATVFVGKFDHVVEDPDSLTPSFVAYFHVQQTYKGKTERVEMVRFVTGDCQIVFQKDKQYIVYDEKKVSGNFCTRTDLVENSKSDLDHIKSLSQANPIYTVSGYIDGLNKEELEQTLLEIYDGTAKKKASPDEHGYFSLTMNKQDKPIVVKIWVPFIAEIYREGFTIEGTKTLIEYEVKPIPNECDFREIFVKKRNSFKR